MDSEEDTPAASWGGRSSSGGCSLEGTRRKGLVCCSGIPVRGSPGVKGQRQPRVLEKNATRTREQGIEEAEGLHE